MLGITPYDRDVLDGQNACIASWQRFVETATIRRWSEHSARVIIYGKRASETKHPFVKLERPTRLVVLGSWIQLDLASIRFPFEIRRISVFWRTSPLLGRTQASLSDLQFHSIAI